MQYKDFFYNNKYASDFGFIAIKPSDSNGSLGISRSLIKSDLTPNKNKINIYGTKYDDTLPLEFLFLKNPNDNKTQKSLEITNVDLSNILSWLTSPKSPRKLKLTNKFECEYCGVFTEVTPYEYGELYGIKATFITDSPYGFRVFKNKFKCVDSNSLDKSINNLSNELEEYVYPKITIHSSTKGEYSIKNVTDNNNVFKFKLDNNYSEVVIDCSLKTIIADGNLLTLDEIGWSEQILDFNNVATNIYKIYWLRLMQGNNKLVINGVGDYLIEYRSAVKNGGY